MRRAIIGGVAAVAISAAIPGYYIWWSAPAPDGRSAGWLAQQPLQTSRDHLEATVAAMQVRLNEDPSDSAAAVRLAEAWLRQARVLGNGALLRKAEAVLDAAIAASSSNYDARRVRAFVYLGQHRFQEALLEAERCRAIGGPAPWIDGVVGDARLELGEIDAAIDAFDRMMRARPDAAAYARASYARELQGDLPGALRLMHMADSATSAHDPEAQAWHAAHLGHLYLSLNDPDAAAMHYLRADLLFPGHPFVRVGLARVDLARGRAALALERLSPTLTASPTPDELAIAGDAHLQLGDPAEAERHYRLAEALWLSDMPDPGALARFRAARGRAEAASSAGGQ